MKFKKSIITSALALSMVVGAGAASATADNTTATHSYWTFSTTQNASLDTFLKQWVSKYQYGSAQVQTGTDKNTQSNTTTSNTTTNKTTSNTSTANKNTSNTTTANTSKTTTTSDSAFSDQVVTLVNQERAKAGVKPLTADKALSAMALDKAKDMYNKGYFDHTSPTYGSPFDMMKTYGINYTYAGENIAKGQKTPQEVMQAWMNSPGHKQNILSPNYTKIGVAYYNSEWVQEFIAN